ncbi:MAG: M18 family aminopeptidase [Deltaproteobacteria bacterium]|nr:M18 family aminopeptidase [Deltaproteobacteria bacterium]
MQDPVADLLSFIDRSPTPYHAVATAVALLEDAGFMRLEESDVWSVAPGDRRYVVRGGSLAAFEVGTAPPAEAGFRIVGAHTDSPNLRVKPAADVRAHGYSQLAVEPYGGVLLHTWLDRDLSLAGRVVVRDGAGLKTELVDLERPVLRVPSLAIHLNRELNQEGLKLNAQQHMAPVVGLSEKISLARLVGDALSGKRARKATKPVEVLAYDLMTYDTQPAARAGAEGELVLAPRLDNLASCHAALRALLASRRSAAVGRAASTRAIVFYDHEEVGSRSQAGAAGSFLADVLTRAAGAFAAPGAKGRTPEQAFERAAARSWLVSADMAHAVHPNYADRHEPGHRPVLGRGPVLKRNVNQSYATDAESAGLFAALCGEVGITPQHFVARSDLGCGSTIGPISAARVGIRTVDVGNPMLSMHSCREMAAAADVAPMIDVLRAFFASELRPPT